MPIQPITKQPEGSEAIKYDHPGQPTKYSVKLSEYICNEIAIGKSLNTIAKELNLEYKTIFNWLDKYPQFLHKYQRARDIQADYYADEIRDIAYSVPATRDEVEKAKLKSNNLMWIASKLKPRKYGDKLDLTSDGEKIPTPIYGGLSLGPKPKRTVTEAEIVKPKQLDKPVK